MDNKDKINRQKKREVVQRCREKAKKKATECFQKIKESKQENKKLIKNRQTKLFFKETCVNNIRSGSLLNVTSISTVILEIM